MTDDSNPSVPEAGWYDDPLTERWWDGSNWTRLTRPIGDERPDGDIVDAAGSVPPGWYPDPITQRRWDGSTWTDETRMIGSASTEQATDAPAKDSELEPPPRLRSNSEPSDTTATPPTPAPPARPRQRRTVILFLAAMAIVGVGVGLAVTLLLGGSDPGQESDRSDTSASTSLPESTQTSSVPATTTPATTPATTTTTPPTTVPPTTTTTSTTTTLPPNLSTDPYFVGLASWTRAGADQMLDASVIEGPAWGYAQHLRQGFRAGSSRESIAELRDIEPGVVELCIGTTCPILSDVAYQGGTVHSFSVDGVAIDGRSRGWLSGAIADCWFIDDAGCGSSKAAEMYLTSIYRFRNTTYVSVEIENRNDFPVAVTFASATVSDRSGLSSHTGEVATTAQPGETKVWILVFGDVDVASVDEVLVTASLGGDLYDFALLP